MWMNWWIGRSLYDNLPQERAAPRVGDADRDRAAPNPGSPAAPGGLATGSQIWGGSVATARQAVQGRTWKDLLTGWRTTTDLLASERSSSRLLALVLLRAAILDEMEAQQPERFALWLAQQPG